MHRGTLTSVASTDEPGTKAEMPPEQTRSSNEKERPAPALTWPESESAVPPLASPPPVRASWRTRIVQSESWVKVVVSVVAVAISLLALVPAFVSMGSKDEPKPTQAVDARYSKNTVTVGPGAHVGDIQFGEPEANKMAFDELKANQEKMLRAIAAEKGVPVASLKVVLQKLGEHDVPPEDIPRRLAAKADEFLALRAQLQSVSIQEVETVRREALQYLEKGDLESARLLVQKAREPLRAQREGHARAEAVLLADEASLDGLEFHYLAAADKYEACAALVHFDRAATASYLEQQAATLYDQGTELGDNRALEHAVSVDRDLLRMRAREHVPLEWAETQTNLGNALLRLGERESGTEHLQQAVNAYQQALLEYRRNRAPLQWAITQTNLGSALSRLGEREIGSERLEQAANAFRQALLESTRERAPLDWAMTQNNLGVALLRVGERDRGTERLQQAVAAFKQALLERDRVPLQWAETQTNLGNALLKLGERENGTKHLQQAVDAYQQALLQYTRNRVPLQWAATQNNLGAALFRLGERERGTERLHQAIAAFKQALLERTRDRVPLDWAATQNNVGNAFLDLGERESGTDQTQQAVAAFKQALLESTRERVPLQWAETQNNLGSALLRLGARDNGTELLEQAVAAFDQALLERPQARVPLDWAATQNNLGIALARLGGREAGTERLQQAVVAHRNAIAVWQQSSVPEDLSMAARRRLAEIEALITSRTAK